MQRAAVFPFLTIITIGHLLAACSAGAPDAWKSVPVMEGAREITSEPGYLAFQIQAPVIEIEEYYIDRLEEAGWRYVGLGEGIGGRFLVFLRGEARLDISVKSKPAGDLAQVVISLR